jgi:hypothetical protein
MRRVKEWGTRWVNFVPLKANPFKIFKKSSIVVTVSVKNRCYPARYPKNGVSEPEF